MPVNAATHVQGPADHDAASTGNPTLNGGYASAAAPADVSADGDAVRAWLLRNGAQAVQVTAAGALIGGDAANGMDVDVTRMPAVTGGKSNNGGVPGATNLGVLPAVANAAAPTYTEGFQVALRTNLAGDVAITLDGESVAVTNAALGVTGGGVEATALRVTLASDSTGLVSVDDNGGSLTVDSAQLPAALVGGRLDVVVGAALPAGTNAIGTVTAVGSAAHDAAIAGNPERIGFRALTANYAAVATGDTADAVSTLVGAQIQKPYSIPEADWSYAAATSGIVNTTTAVTVQTAGAAGIRNYVTGLQLSSDALGAATEFAIRDGAGGTVLWRMKIGTTGLPDGLNVSFPSPIKGTAATLLEVVTLTASVTGGVFVNLQGFQAP